VQALHCPAVDQPFFDESLSKVALQRVADQ
jgi:hypothetical protein